MFCLNPNVSPIDSVIVCAAPSNVPTYVSLLSLFIFTSLVNPPIPLPVKSIFSLSVIFFDLGLLLLKFSLVIPVTPPK